MSQNPPNLKDLGLTGLRELMARWGYPSFRADQVGRWAYRMDVASFQDMANLPASLREKLASEFRLERAHVAEAVESQDGSTKYAVRFTTGDVVETVYMPTARRITVCLSSQTGCAMGCVFCATGARGPGRTLTVGEILEQLALLVRPLPLGAGRARPTHVVFMGMGEPLLDPRPVVEALRVLTWEHGFGYAARRITVSTCGVPEGMRALAQAGMRVGLALSLNAPWEGLRASLMPKAAPLSQVIPALRDYRAATRATVTLEYVLIKGVNDAPACARGLGELARSVGAKVNLIACNPTQGPWASPSPEEVARFASLVQPLATVTVRHSMGGDIRAACGQLAPR